MPFDLISIQYLGVQLMWIVIHSLIWDGKISNYEDMALSLLSPGCFHLFSKHRILYNFCSGIDVPLSEPSRESLESPSRESSSDESSESQSAASRFTLDSLSELSFVKIWNYFTDPNPSTRNLYLNIGFVKNLVFI